MRFLTYEKHSRMKKEGTNIGYRIADICTVKFIFESLEVEKMDELLTTSADIHLVLGVQTHFDLANNSVQFDISTDLKYHEKVWINHIGRTSFEMNGLPEIEADKQAGYEFPLPLLEQLYGISFSHARALLATETARTNFNGKFYLPVVDPREFLAKSKKG